MISISGLPEWLAPGEYELTLTIKILCWKATTGDLIFSFFERNNKCIGTVSNNVSLNRGDYYEFTINIKINHNEDTMFIADGILLSYWGGQYYCEAGTLFNIPFLYPGTIKALTNIPEGSYTICRGCDYVPPHEVISGSGDEVITFTNKKPDEWTIEFKDVEGYKTPPSETKTLQSLPEGDMIDFYGEYEAEIPPEEDVIVVKSNIDEASYDIYFQYIPYDNRIYDHQHGKGKETVFTSEFTGWWYCFFNSVENYLTPCAQFKKQTLQNGRYYVEFYGEYLKSNGNGISKKYYCCNLLLLLIIIYLLWGYIK